MTKKKANQLEGLVKLMTKIGEATGHKDLSLHSINVFLQSALAVENKDPVDSRELAKLTGLSTSGVSRAVALLGDWHRGKPGLGLVSAVPDLNDRRVKPVKLTRRGEFAIDAILKAIP